MKLIKKLNTRKDKSGNWKIWGMFLCPYCNQIIEKRLIDGKRNQSCGCYSNKLIAKANTVHGDTTNNKISKLYIIYENIKTRCYNKNHKSYKYYGGRGIKVCDMWQKNYLIFKIWAISHGYKKRLTIDRINNDRNYEPNNCKFSTKKEQAQNRKTTKMNWTAIKMIRELFKIGYTRKELFGMFDITYRSLCYILNNKRWKNYS